GAAGDIPDEMSDPERRKVLPGIPRSEPLDGAGALVLPDFASDRGRGGLVERDGRRPGGRRRIDRDAALRRKAKRGKKDGGAKEGRSHFERSLINMENQIKRKKHFDNFYNKDYFYKIEPLELLTAEILFYGPRLRCHFRSRRGIVVQRSERPFPRFPWLRRRPFLRRSGRNEARRRRRSFFAAR